MSQETTNKPKKNLFTQILGWFFGVTFAIGSLGGIGTEPIPAIMLLISALILIPPTHDLIEKHLNVKLTKKIKTFIFIGAFIIFAATMEEVPEEETPIIETSTEQAESTEEKKEETPKVESVFKNGTQVVGEDVEPGTYRSDGTRTCYWERMRWFDGGFDDIIANGNYGTEIVTISASDAAFKATGCGKWYKLEDTYPETPATSFGDGTFEVGTHIEAGTYKADGNPDDMCYWSRLAHFSHSGISGILANGNNPTVINVLASDKGFTTKGCGTWTKM